MITTRKQTHENGLETSALGDDLSDIVIGAAAEVHRVLGPGLNVDVYRDALAVELAQAGVRHECGRELPMRYKGVVLRSPHRLGMVVDGLVVVDITTSTPPGPESKQRLEKSMELAGCTLALAIHFDATKFHCEVHSVVCLAKRRGISSQRP